jgi:hypothetical protein
MNEMRSEYIRAIVAETLAEQQRLRHDDINAVVAKTVATILISFGIEKGIARGLSTPAALAQERRTGAEFYVQGRDHNHCYRIRRGSVAWRQGHARQMIRAIVTILMSSLERTVPR